MTPAVVAEDVTSTPSPRATLVQVADAPRIEQPAEPYTNEPTVDLAVTVPAGLSLTRKMHVQVRYNGPIKAPIKKGDEVAQLVVTTGDTDPQVVPLVAGEDVGEAGFFTRAWIGLKSLLGMA